MSKLKKVIITALILVAVGLIGSLITFNSAFHAEEIKEEIDIYEEFTSIEISADNASIHLVSTNEEKATVTIRGKENKLSTYDISTGVENEQLFVHVKDDRRIKLFSFFPKFLTVTVHVSKEQYESINIENDNGRVEIDEIDALIAYTDVDNGEIKMNNVHTDEVEAELSNGNIEFEKVTATNVYTDVDNGKISLDDVSGNLVGDVNNGQIVLETNDLDRSIQFDVDNGEIKIRTENEPTNAAFHASVDNGKVSIFEHSSKNTIFGNGENIIQLSANNGKITVEKK